MPASTSQAFTVGVRRGSTMTICAGASGSRAELGFLLVRRGAAQVRDPVVQEVVGLRFQRVGADRNDGVGELGVLVAVVELAHAHVAGAVDFAEL